MPGDDMWIVSGYERIKDEEIHLDKQLVVLAGGHLQLEGTTFHVTDGGSIHVAPGGTLIIEESELKRHGQSPRWSFEVMGRLEMNQSILSGSQGIELFYAGTLGSQIVDSHLVDNRPHAVFVLRRGDVDFRDNLVEDNGFGIQVHDATANIQNNVFIGNSGWSIELISSLAGSRLVGPVIAQVQGNVIAYGGGGIDVQEGNKEFLTIEENLLTGLYAGLRFYEGGDLFEQAEITRNSLVENRAAAFNYPRAGERESISHAVGYTVDLGDSWLGEEGPTWDAEAANRLYGPFHTDKLLDHDPVPHLWERLENP